MNGLDEHFFINPGINVSEVNGELGTIIGLSKEQLKARWDTPKGQSILTRWKTNGFRRDILDSQVGKYYGHTDLRGINLSKEVVHNADLTYVDLFCANLEDTIFDRCNFGESWLSESNL